MRRTPWAIAVSVAVLLAGSGSGCTITSTSSSKPSPGGSTTPGVDYTAWSAGRSAPVADPIYPKRGNPDIDVLHYGLELAWQPDELTLTGTATLRVRPTTDATQLSLDFMPYTLDAVTVDGSTVTGSVTGEKLAIPAKLVKDQPVTLVVRYHGMPKTTPMPSHRKDMEPLGLTITNDKGLWTMQEPFGAFTWYPANDQPSDEALYDIAVTVPPGWSAIASGTPAGQDGDTFRYRSTDPVATYLTTLAVGKYAKETAKGPRGIPLTYWYRPGKDKKLLPILRTSPALLAWLEKRLGPYPFPSGGLVIVDSESGMETQQMITMGGRIGIWSQRKEKYQVDVLHEWAHQWLGDSVTPTNWRDVWLNEGWATYIQYLWMVERDKVSANVLDPFFQQVDKELRKKLGPPGKPRADSFAEGNVYFCAAAMLRKLHKALGDKKFFALARAWAQDNRNTQQDRASFIAFVNKHTGKDFTKLINTWLDSKTTPR